MPRQIVLLRGINLGSKRRVAMGELRELLEGHGYGDVRTLLQSGNVVMSGDLAPDRLRRELQQQLANGLGFDVDVIVRTRDEIADVIRRNPLAKVATDPKRYQVTFLSAKPPAGVVRELRAVDIAPERVAFSGREIFAWHPEGVQRSRLATLIADERLAETATARNWNTVNKLLKLADE